MASMSSWVICATTPFISAPIEPWREPILEVVELAEEIHRRMSGDGRHFTQAVERRSVADHALNRFSSAAGGYEFLAFGQAALSERRR